MGYDGRFLSRTLPDIDMRVDAVFLISYRGDDAGVVHAYRVTERGNAEEGP